VLRDYPESTHAKLIGTQKRQREALGKPFELQFTDAVSGAEVSITTLRGKIVVVSFWATWCGPCVAEMPRMKELYAQYHERGVEFIGVSLDVPEEEGGLARLKQFVQKNQIPWPQYYQGGVGENTFSATWGVNEIPAVFVIDADGKLASAEAKDKLGQLIPAMLERKGVGSQ
jgi:thiol-disulfide isomerase/thioredoxin